MISFKKMLDEFYVTKSILIVGEEIKKMEEIIEKFGEKFSEDYKGLINHGTEMKIKVGKKKSKIIFTSG